MNINEAPKKQPVPFAINGQRENLLTSTPAGDNTASYDAGFPPVTMILKAAGGLPPKGQDMNQILYELSSLARWSSAGALNTFDSSFSASIGGYPKGAMILGDDGISIYQSAIDNNGNNPNSSSTGWRNLSTQYLARQNPFSDIKTDGTVSIALENLGLGNVVNLGQFRSQQAGQGWCQRPDGVMMQWGGGAITYQGQLFNFPTRFPNNCYQIVISDVGSGALSYGASPVSLTQFQVYANIISGGNSIFRYMAIGN